MLIFRAFGACFWLFLALSSTQALAESFPNLLGKQLGEAKYLAEKSNFEVVAQEIDSLQAIGKVLLQIPAGGTLIDKDRRIFLQVSDGIVVPALTTKPLADAQMALTALNLGFASSARRHDGLVKGTVASQVPRAGERIDATRQVVFLDVVGGRYVTVPPVNGKLLSDALAAIRNGELAPTENPVSASYAQKSEQEERLNCDQVRTKRAIASSTQPAAGTEIYPGWSVTVNWDIQNTDRNDKSKERKCRPVKDMGPNCSKPPYPC